MSGRMVVDQWSFEEEGTVPNTVDEKLVQEFINWLLNNHSWKEYPDLLVDRAFTLRKKLLADLQPDSEAMKAHNVRHGPKGQFVKRVG